MDPLSDVLSLLKPRSFNAGGFDKAGDWAVRFGAYEGLKCYAAISGHFWLAVEGVDEAIHVGPGECILLPSGRPFRMASDLALAPTGVAHVAGAPLNGAFRTIKGGGDCLTIGCSFAFDGGPSDMLLGVLPSVVHIHDDGDKQAIQASIDRLMNELRDPRPGGAIIAHQTATTLLVQMLRQHLAERAAAGVGWLFALADEQLRSAIEAMHGEPGAPWTLRTLAALAGMSRTGFAIKFKQRVGKSPVEYLTGWRMVLARDRLVNSSDRIAVIAQSLGYESESAFSTAFKRVVGCSPRQYCRSR